MAYERTGKCKVCGVKVIPQWTYCRDHSKGSILLESDTGFMDREIRETQSRYSELFASYKRLMLDYVTLDRQHQALQEVFYALVKHKCRYMTDAKLRKILSEEFKNTEVVT